MPEIKILTEADLREIAHLDLEAVDCVERAFAALAQGGVVMPPILSMAIPDHNGEVDVKTAYVPGVESFAIKMSPGFFDNPKIGLPSTSGLMILFSARTGMVEALLLDNGYLTDVRTAAAGAVAAKHLAPEDARTACIVGAGTQAKLQLQALRLVRPIEQARYWARDVAKAEATAHEMAQALGIDVKPTTHLQDAVGEADVIVTTTPSSQPLIKAEWLRAGQHVTAMGSDQDHKNELDPSCFTRADLYVPDRQSQTRILGELHHALAAEHVADDRQFDELGDIVAGKAPGRRTPEDLTICDLTGTGIQDTAIATFARQRAVAAGAGTPFNS
ncbi:ectoine utilization protein EutC [Roseibium sp. MMSF_3544]|uniref:ectoine utilization protein EutC n=1 Tax=unclassified Roseibium TaxID=2629323 RepID=UPI00273D7D7A|nr:ectoine utilization protein EutC [Roseibium sp. MMSF_3544]